MNKFWMVVLVALASGGCSSDDSDPTVAFCNGFGIGATFTWTSCTNCSPTNPGNASDGNLTTETSIVPTGGATTETFVFTATSVNDIAGGAVVGAWVTQPSTITVFSTDFQTYLDGSLQEELDVPVNGVTLQADEGTPAGGFIGMRTTEAFDEVRFTRNNQWNAGADPVYRVYEVCSDGGAA
jgi:hypothetical protein